MPDLDGELAELRTQLRHTVHQPEVATVIERSRQRRVRRRTQLGAVAAVVVVAAAIPVLRTALRPVNEHPVGPGTLGSSSEPVITGIYTYDVDFANTRNGYILRASCTDRAYANCSLELLATEDAEHWEARTLPDDVARNTGGRVMHLHVLGARAIAVGEIYPQGSARRFSSDGGKSWVPVADPAGQTTQAIPPGGMIHSGCVFATEPMCQAKLAAIDPGSGRPLVLATQPPVENPVTASTTPVAGAWWVLGTDPQTGRWTFARSLDDGRTWSTAGMPTWEGGAGRVTMATTGTIVYAAVTQMTDANAPFAIFRSEDGGKRWEQTFQSVDGAEPRSLAGGLLATRDGRLQVTSALGKVWNSTDGGRHFTPAASAEFAQVLGQTRAGYLAIPAFEGSSVYKLSTDGVRWRELIVVA